MIIRRRGAIRKGIHEDYFLLCRNGVVNFFISHSPCQPQKLSDKIIIKIKFAFRGSFSQK